MFPFFDLKALPPPPAHFGPAMRQTHAAWGKRRLPRYRRDAKGKLWQLHATRGWKKV